MKPNLLKKGALTGNSVGLGVVTEKWGEHPIAPGPVPGFIITQ